MKHNRFSIVTTVWLAGCVATGAVAAEPAASTPALGGPLVPGICLLSREAVIANSAVGKAVAARIQELTKAAQAEIDRKRGPIEAEAKALEAKGDGAKSQPQRDALGQRWQDLRSQALRDNREIEATRAKALARIANEAQPAIAQVYSAHKCGLLFDRSVALGGNFANDLTAEVVKALDAKVTSLAIERERLPEDAVQR